MNTKFALFLPLCLLVFQTFSAAQNGAIPFEGTPKMDIRQAISIGEKAMKKSGRDLNNFKVMSARWIVPDKDMDRDAKLKPIIKEFGTGPFWEIRFRQNDWNEKLGQETGDYYGTGLSVWVYSATSAAVLDHYAEEKVKPKTETPKAGEPNDPANQSDK